MFSTKSVWIFLGAVLFWVDVDEGQTQGQQDQVNPYPSMPISQILGKPRRFVETLFTLHVPEDASGLLSYNDHLLVRYADDILVEFKQKVPMNLDCLEAARWVGFAEAQQPIREGQKCHWPGTNSEHNLSKDASGTLFRDSGWFQAQLKEIKAKIRRNGPAGELDDMASCFFDAVTVLQEEPKKDESLYTFLDRASRKRKEKHLSTASACWNLKKGDSQKEVRLSTGDNVLFRKESTSHDSLQEGKAEFSSRYIFFCQQRKESSSTTIVLRIGGN